jgi:hypothetical protein
MEIHTTGISRWEKPMAKEFTHGSTAKFMTENGTWALSLGMESGAAFITTLTSVSGTKAKLMGTVCILGRTETGTKASGTNASNTELELISLLMATPILEIIRMASLMAKVSIPGLMEPHI